ncbi:MAG TPA: N-methyl-L-tryptophan oxidase [Caulobacteraceae bacterium]|nr:N-methyl-L-tryptophan oxidase [Caulobacteraceae bacterium]
MRTCDVAVVGLGLMGAAAMRALAARGADVLGFDPLRIGEPRGSSHGSCRVFRRFNFESPAYTRLSDRAFLGWRELEAECGRSLLLPCPVLEAGPPGSALVAASRSAAAAAGAAGAASNDLTGAEANAVYSALDLPADWDVVVQDSGGILLAEEALRALRAPVAERIVEAAVRIEPGADGVAVTTGAETVLALKVVVAAGPWIAQLVPRLAPVVRIVRHTVGWFRPQAPSAAAYGRLPIFLLEAPQGVVYGFPDFEGRGVKAGGHHGLDRIVGPDAWGPPPSDAELEPVRSTLERLMPGAAGPIVERDVCLYTNTIAADVRPDGGEEFIIDRLPADPRLVVISACSGHGAKFATVVGEMAANLALEPDYRADPAFRLDRYSAFAS